MPSTRCREVLIELLGDNGCQQMPWVLLRPREMDEPGVFEGDFDLLVDESRIHDIVETIFKICQRRCVSFVLDQYATFKRIIEIIEDDSRKVTLELWTHAEFRTHPDQRHVARSAIDYQDYIRVPTTERPTLLAVLFILHLHHKQKDIGSESVRWRLDYFLDQHIMDPGVRDALQELKTPSNDIVGAHSAATAFLRSHGIHPRGPGSITSQEWMARMRRRIQRTVPKTIVMVGPDGSGKTTLLDMARERSGTGAPKRVRFKYFFRRFVPYIHRSEPQNVRDEKMLWLILPVAWLYFVADRYVVNRASPVVVERYFYDYFVRNVRDSEMPLQRISCYGLCRAVTPRPARLVVASCLATQIHQRKQEMTIESIDRLYAIYLDQVIRTRIRVTLFCHTGIPADISSHQFVKFCDAWLGTRTSLGSR